MNKKVWATLALFCAAAACAQSQATRPSAAQEAAIAAPALVPEPSWNELLAAKQYAELEARMSAAFEAGTSDLASYRTMRHQLAKLVTALPITRARFDEWIAATDSGTAYLARGEFLAHTAAKARGDKTIDRTHPDAIARMEELKAAAGADYKVALEKSGPRCDVCYAGLIDTYMTLGPRAQGAALVDRAMQALDGGIAAPNSYLFYLAPKWGGSLEEAQRFVDRFAADGPQRAAIPLLRGKMLVDRSEELLRMGLQEQALLVAQQAATTDPGNASAWEAIAVVAMRLERAPLILEASERALALPYHGPYYVYVLNARASVLLRSATPLEAVPFLERAVAQGDEWALKALMPIVAAGQHGFKPDRERAQKICQSAIDALMPAGFACMGGLEYFGMGRPANKPRALQWFLEASDRGVTVAMVDAATMLLRGDGGPRDEKRAIDLLVKAHEGGEPRAEGLLRANLSTLAYWQRVEWPGLRSRGLEWLNEGGRFLLYVLGLIGKLVF